MDPSQDFNSLQEAIQKSLVSTVKSANRIASQDLSFQRTINPDVAEQLDEKTSRILDLSTRLLSSAAQACGLKPIKFEDPEDVDMNWRAVVDVVDSILEKADRSIDEYTGLVKQRENGDSDSNSKTKQSKSTGKVIRNANVKKPQLDFEIKPNNFFDGPWKPILTEKPHATVPLDESLVTFVRNDGTTQYRHPYEHEITNMQYPDRIFQIHEPIPPQPAETTSATWVDTYEGVLAMLEELKEAKEIAVDLEHHDFRTYVGLVSLLQISTREKDWVVDTLKPWRHKLQVLNEVFADPAIVKVFHGAYMDMVWLQRDLGLYVNGLFDTFFASDALHYSSRSLAFLLSKFVNFDADKRYQLADWRIRPLSEEMMYYARSDTHYLLYIYDRIRNELVESSDSDKHLVHRVLNRSRELSLSRHENPESNAETGEGSRGWFNFVLKNSQLGYKSDQFAIFRALWNWRDLTARKEDENPNFVLGNNNLTEIVRVNPPDAKALHSLLPLSAALARSRVNEMWTQMQEEKARGGPSLLQFFSSRDPATLQSQSGVPRVTKTQTPALKADGDVTATKLARSQLFGNVAVSSQWDETKGSVDVKEDYFPFPWQRFIGDVADVVVEAEPQKEPVVATPVKEDTTPAAEVDKDEEFTLRRGQKRKAEEAEENDESRSSEADSASDGDEEMQDENADDNAVIEIEDEDVPSRAAKKAKKLEKKKQRDEARAAQEQQRLELRTKRQEEKLARKEQRRNQHQAKTEEPTKYQAVPFDYSKAASVLHAKRDETKESAQEAKKKAFDPYAKTGDDEIKPARKMPPVRGEKSATFKK